MANDQKPKVLVGCKLPNGLVIEHPKDPTITATLKGRNREEIIGAGYGVTAVDSELWDAWIKSNADFVAVKNGAIYIAKDERDLKAISKEREKEKTGLEPMQTDGKDPRAKGVKTDEPKNDPDKS